MATAEGSMNASYVKHTTGAEMPDPSAQGQTLRRLRAAAPVLRGKVTGNATVITSVIAAAGLLGIAAYFFWRQPEE